MSKSLKITLIVIAVLCILILLVESGYIIYKAFLQKEEQTYFDSINSFSIIENGYIAVGSNNDNDMNYEKANITKYNSKKEKKWDTIFNQGYNSVFYDVCEDKGSFIAVGSYEVDENELEEGLKSALLVKYDKDGTLLFSKKFQVLGNSKFTRIKVVADGYIVVGQSIYENSTLGNSDEGGAFIIKYDKEGNVVWKDNYGGSKSGLYNDFVIVDDNIYVVGKDAARVGIIVKYNMNGERLEVRNYEYTDTLGFTSIVSKDNSLYVVGAKKVTDDQDDYDTDSLIIKYNMDFSIDKEQTFRGEGIERYNRMILDSNGDLVIVGQTGVYNKKKSTKTLNVFSYDGLIAKYKDDLTEVFVNYYGEDQDDYFTDIKEENSNYILSGYSGYEDDSFLAKFVIYSKAGKVLDVK